MDALDRALIHATIRDFPRYTRPFARLAQQLSMNEDDVILRFRQLHESGIVQRIGPVIAPNTIGASTLAAISVPKDQVEAIAQRINQFPEVNHNYEREHEYNLWFVITAASRARIDEILALIQSWVTAPVLDLPMEKSYFIDLGFAP